ncbi:MAG TPA: PH domain-containing protein [Acidimicrobiales bacterium]
MPFSRKLLNEGEDIVLDLHPHWWFFAKSLAALVATSILGLYVLFGWDGAPGWAEAIVGVLVLATLLWFGLAYARWVTTNFVITTDRLIYRHGVLSKHGIEIPLDRVNTVFFSQSIFERMVGSGDLTIESAGEMGRQAFSNVRKPSAVQNEIYKQMEANENRKFDRVGANNPNLGAASIPAQIEQLDDLRQRGLISEAEFQTKKAELLGRM